MAILATGTPVALATNGTVREARFLSSRWDPDDDRRDDGFLIAEEDLAMRGAGDVLGTVQSGLPRFRSYPPPSFPGRSRVSDLPETTTYRSQSCDSPPPVGWIASAAPDSE